MAYACLNQCFDLLTAEIDAFLISDSANTIVYDNGALVRIIRNKELKEVCKVTSESIETFEGIYSELGKMVSAIIKSAHSSTLNAYLEIESRINSSFSGLFHLYAKQTALSVKALLFYKLGCHAEALAATHECIALNDILVQNGMHSLLYRCMEQNKNIARIYQKQGMKSLSEALLKTIFNFLFNGQVSEGVLQGSVEIYKQSWKKSLTLRESYTYELFRITVEDGLRNNAPQPETAKKTWFSELEFDVTNSDRQVIYNWIYINNQLADNNYKEYIESIIYFMKQRINFSYDPLKIHLIHDLCALVKGSQYSNKVVLMSKLVRFMDNKVHAKRIHFQQASS